MRALRRTIPAVARLGEEGRAVAGIDPRDQTEGGAAGDAWHEEAGAGRAGVVRFWRRLRSGDTFYFLFVLLLLNFVVVVVVRSAPGQVLTGALSAATPLVALLAAKAPRRYLYAGAMLFVIVAILTVVGAILDDTVFMRINFGLYAGILFFCIPVTLLRLFEHEQVTGESVAGSLCVYLLIGMGFAALYLSASAGNVDPILSSSSGAELDRGDYYYYSFIAMLTVGFGDIVPITDWARALTVLQAIFGQVVLLTLVARMVSTAQLSHRVVRRFQERTRKLETEERRQDEPGPSPAAED
jgi:hypothetical protein